MISKFLELDNIRIAYWEKNKEAFKTIFFIHGNSMSKNCWRKQFDGAELKEYRIIAIDLPAHGDSGVEDEFFYTLPNIAKKMSKVIAILARLQPYIISGVSLGTNIVAEMLSFEVNPVGLIFAGPCIAGENLGIEKFAKPNTHVGVVFTDEPDFKDVISYAHETSLSDIKEDLDYFLNDYKRVKSPFRSSIGKSIFEKNYSDEIALINKKNIPCLIVFGKDEKVIDCDYLDNIKLPLWNKAIFKIEGASHLVNVDQPAEFNNLVAKFGADVFK